MKHLSGADEVKLTKNIFPNDERLLDYVTCKRRKKERNDIKEIWKVTMTSPENRMGALNFQYY